MLIFDLISKAWLTDLITVLINEQMIMCHLQLAALYEQPATIMRPELTDQNMLTQLNLVKEIQT